MIFPNRVRNSRKPGPRRKSRMSSTNNPPRPGRYGADQMERTLPERNSQDSEDDFQNPNRPSMVPEPPRPVLSAEARDFLKKPIFHLKVPELRKILGEMGKDTTGMKGELVVNIREYLRFFSSTSTSKRSLTY